jgi:antitoxin HigA-1
VKKLNLHPGEILAEEFLEPLGMSQYRLAKETGLPETRISDIVLGKRGITADTALRLSAFFGNSAQFWLNLQNTHDLRAAERRIGLELKKIRRFDARPRANAKQVRQRT